jgi:hypothetical protein
MVAEHLPEAARQPDVWIGIAHSHPPKYHIETQ